MAIKKNPHTFMFDESGPKLLCRNCRELIAPADVEMFYACPYCNTAVNSDDAIYDFTITQLTKHWEGRCLNPHSGIVGVR